MADRRSIVARTADSWTVAVAVASIVIGAPTTVRAGEPGVPLDGLVESTSPPLELVAREDAAAGQQVVQRRKVVVDLRFSPERAVRGARMRLRAIDQPGLSLERPLLAPTATVTLTTGTWRLEVRARRHAADLDLVVGPGQRPIDVALVRHPRAQDTRLVADRKLVLGVLGSFAVTYATGIGLLVGAANRERRAEKRDAAAYTEAGLDPAMPGVIDPAAQAVIEAAYPAARLHRDLASAADLHAAGGVIAGVSVGAAVSAIPLALRARRRAAVLELGFGVALLAGGSGWLAWSLGESARLLDDPRQRVAPRLFDRGDGHRIASSLFTGLGLGLSLFSGAVLVSDKVQRRTRDRAFASAPWAGAGLAGWSLAGRF